MTKEVGMRFLFFVTVCLWNGQAFPHLTDGIGKALRKPVDFLSLHLLDGDRVKARIHHFYCYLTHFPPTLGIDFLASNYYPVINCNTYHNLLGR